MTMRLIIIAVLALALLQQPARAQQLDQERATARACEQAGAAFRYAPATASSARGTASTAVC